jgi:uncharacterized membrane protein
MTDEERRELAELRAAVDGAVAEVRRLGERIHALESTGPASGAAAAAPAPPPRAAATPAPIRPPPLPTRREPPPRVVRPSPVLAWLRTFFAEGNPLDKLGALSLIVGAAVVFKYAVDNQWIGPTGRVALGLATGAALLAGGEALARRGWRLFASGIVAAGDGVLFVSVYFGQQQYGVVPASVAFGLYVSVTAAVAAQSLRYDALGLAIWGLLGGYLAPALASTGSGNYVLLSSYLLVLDAGVLAIAYRRDWQPLKWMAFVLTVLYTTGWVLEFTTSPGETRWLALHWLLPYLAAFFLSFAAIPTWRSLRLGEPVDAFGQALTVANGVVHFGLTAWALHDHPRAWLGLVAAVVAALYAWVSSRVVRQPVVDAKAVRVFAGTAAGFLLLATPYLVSGPAITLVWCAQTSALAWACTKPRYAFLRLHVLAMLAVVAVRLLAFDGLLDPYWGVGAELYVPFAALRSWPPLAAAATFAAAAYFVGRTPGGLPGAATGAVGVAVLLVGLDAEAQRGARLLLAPLASPGIQDLVRAGLLVTTACAPFLLGFAALRRAREAPLWWRAGLVVAVLLTLLCFETLLWPGSFGSMRRVLGDGLGLSWLHAGTVLLVPLAFLLLWLARHAPPSPGGSRERTRTVLFAVSIVVAMLLLRREAFAIVHAPPLADLFPEAARRASYRTILSVSYGLLAFAVYLQAVRSGMRSRLHAAYALYVFTGLKVYFFDLEAQNQLYRAFSLVVFAAILFVSSWFANRQQRQHA